MTPGADLHLMESFEIGIEIPAALQPTVRRHQASLAALVESLQAAGVDDATVEGSVRSLVESYRRELTAAIGHMVEYR